ncbi:fungal-specific transcription factor domain-containing protein [Lipomyces tetrasporus]|uniref:Fungal-specific transcription factor domain-containing protein n=1 Tax=Lipomyces tetrasporus TaxID=54092 RepID=A0AAD7QN59_9ASCO|nr:fungal-specific transcription factor domain-containing protein [Lipomyces tetrasporus]KAJ8098278.1 fungal-specific transcription factor domain-containing protein [Lipomyces tetrasporus]
MDHSPLSSVSGLTQYGSSQTTLSHLTDEQQYSDSGHSQSQSRKRRRSRKGLEKVFECDAQGCGKRFTRSEHLARHQLNHEPKEIFTCTWPDCTKSFVREDLRIRHLERHRRRGEATTNGDIVLKEEDTTNGNDILHEGIGNIMNRRNSTASSSSSHISGSLASITQSVQPAMAVPDSMYMTMQQQPTQAPTTMSHYNMQPQQVPQQSGYMPPPSHTSPLGISPRTQQNPIPLANVTSPANGNSTNTADLINWLFSDGMLSGARDLFLPSNLYSGFESPMDLPNLLTPPTPPPSRMMSEAKRLDILGLIPNLESHADFELDCIHRYIVLYWDKFHFQFPILHKPSFEADSTPGPLLYSIILIGAYFGGAHDLALKIAEQLRWVIFGSPGFHPPAKVWIIQSLLILEVYEKTMSTRKFHERAHIHHGTTLQLIRRGSTLVPSSSANSTAPVDGSSEIWKRWIEAEMAKRAAFMAFILDVCHAALFAHSLVMSTHEIRLSLPCDEDAWDAIPGNRNHALRTPTMPFLKALKKLLNQQSVATGRFGSVVLLCGLMSLSYQMEQLDLQISSLGWGAFRDTWRTTLAPALDFWKADYDRRFPRINVMSASPGDSTHLQRVVPPMWHMAHVAMRVSIYDLQIFCGVHRVLGRPTRHQDYLASKRRMSDWAISERAREATLHAVQSIYEAFVIGDLGSYYRAEGYSAGEDTFVHRAIILNHCAQVVWAYGFCLEGPESSALNERDSMVGSTGRSVDDDFEDDEEWVKIAPAEDGRVFLERLQRAKTGRELEAMEGKNHTVGLLRMVTDALKSSKWQLMKEFSDVLRGCIQRSLGREENSVRGGRVYYDE